MSNILTAIYNIHNLHNLDVVELTFGNNRATNVGDGLEQFVKDCFSSSIGITSEKDRIQNYANIFSYQGSPSRPPDLMLRGGDAIEVKKVESIQSELQLNSSHPKCKLLSTSTLINNHCIGCENWSEKDIVYIVGHIPKGKKKLSSLWMVYGSIYAADENVYTSLKTNLTQSLENTDDIDFSPTKELGRVNFVDPLQITKVRIRGMWLLKPPREVYSYIYTYNPELSFQLFALIPIEKYNSFDEESRSLIEENVGNGMSIENTRVKNPNNPVNLLDAKLITITID